MCPNFASLGFSEAKTSWLANNQALCRVSTPGFKIDPPIDILELLNVPYSTYGCHNDPINGDCEVSFHTKLV